MAVRYLTHLLLLMMCLGLARAGFDLNAMPDEETDPDSQDDVEPSPSQVAAQARQRAQALPGPSPKPGKISREQAKKLKEINQKTQELFKVLEMCDSDSFDINKIKIPDSWTKQSKAMMVLVKVSKQKLIRQSDMPKLKRILANCKEIEKRVNEITESKMSMESQMSGMNYDDAAKFQEQIENSPLEKMRQNFLKSNRDLNKQLVDKPETSPTTTTTTETPLVRGHNLLPHAANAGGDYEDEGDVTRPVMFQFI